MSIAFFTAILIFFMFFLQHGPVVELYGQTSDTAVQDGDKAAPAGEEGVPGQGFEGDFGPKADDGSLLWEIVKVMFVLVLFGGGFYMFYKFISQKVGLNIAGQEAIRTLSMVPVGPNKTLQIIDVAGKLFLIGVTDSSINMITEIKDKDDIDRIRLLSSRSTPVQGKNFQEFVADQMGWVVEKIKEKRSHGFKKTTVEEISEKDIDMSYLDNQKKRLKKINHEDEE